MIRTVLAMVGALGMLLTGAVEPRGGPAPGTPACPEPDSVLVEAGRELFAGSGNCFACHGSDATGTPLAPDLTDAVWLDADGSYASIVAVVTEGVSAPKEHPAPMPPLGGASLTSGQVCAVAAFVHSLSR